MLGPLASEGALRAASNAVDLWLSRAVDRELKPPYTEAQNRRCLSMSETLGPEIRRVNAARVVSILNQRLGDPTTDWTKLPLDPADQESWTPFASR
jgi:hypothetical protein